MPRKQKPSATPQIRVPENNRCLFTTIDGRQCRIYRAKGHKTSASPTPNRRNKSSTPQPSPKNSSARSPNSKLPSKSIAPSGTFLP